MKTPKVKSVQVLDAHRLMVEFDNAQKKTYDISPLLKNEMFSPLKNPAFFKTARVEQGGYAVVWDSQIDISEYELWRNGEAVSEASR